MPQKNHRFLQICCLFFLASEAQAVTLTSGQTDYTTTGNITTSGVGISSTLVGTSSSYDKIKNTYTITTGNSGATSSAYGIKVTGDYNQITNDVGAAIVTTGSSGRGISTVNRATVFNAGSISTQGSTSYGIYAGGDNNSVSNSGSITTSNTSSYGIYLNGDNNSATNSGSINTQVNGIRVSGNNSTVTNSGSVTSATYAIYNAGSGTVIDSSGTLSGGVFVGSGTLNISGGSISGTVDGSSGTGSVKVGSSSSPSVSFNQSSSFNNLDTLTIQSSSTLNSSASISANTILIDANSVLTLNDGSSLSGAIAGVSDSVGTLNISGISFASSDAIGVSGGALANLNINSGGSVAAVSDIYAANILLAGTLNFSGANNLTIHGSLAGSGAGTLNVGSQNQTISGNFSLASGDELAVTLKSGGVGSLAVSGSAAIDANSKLAITTSASQGYITSGTQYNLASAGLGSSINSISDSNIFVNGANTNSYGLLEFSTTATSDSLILNVNRLTAAEITSDKNAQNIYQALSDAGEGSGKLLEFQNYLDNSGFKGDAMTSALNQLAPQGSKAALATTNNVVSNSIKITESRLEKTRRGEVVKVLKNRAWAQGFGGSALQRAIANDAGYKANSAGLSFGADQEISDTALVGAAFSFAKSSVKVLNSVQQNLIDSYQINFYGSQNFGKYFLDSVAGFAWNHFDSNRAITALNTNAMAGYSGQTYALKIKTGWLQNLQHGFSLSPEASLNFLRNNIGGYNEKGAGELNLRVSSVSANFLEGRTGLNLGYATRISELPEFKKVVALLKISYGYAFVNDAPTVTAGFVGQSGSFNSQISHVDRGSLKLGFELDAFHKDNSTFSADYTFEKRTTYESHFILLKVREEF